MYALHVMPMSANSLALQPFSETRHMALSSQPSDLKFMILSLYQFFWDTFGGKETVRRKEHHRNSWYLYINFSDSFGGKQTIKRKKHHDWVNIANMNEIGNKASGTNNFYFVLLFFLLPSSFLSLFICLFTYLSVNPPFCVPLHVFSMTFHQSHSFPVSFVY